VDASGWGKGVSSTWTSISRDLAPSLGDGKKFRRPRFLNEIFLGKIPIFTPKISDDLFKVIDHIFQIFPIFSHIFHIFTVCIYDSFFTKNLISENNSSMTPFFLLCSCFRAHPTNTTSQNTGSRMHGPSPTSNFGVDRPPQSP